MSSTLYYFDSVTGERAYCFKFSPDKEDLKYKVARKYFDHDGSLGSDECEYLDSRDVPFLQGLRHKDADHLIGIIGKHGSVKISIRG